MTNREALRVVRQFRLCNAIYGTKRAAVYDPQTSEPYGPHGEISHALVAASLQEGFPIAIQVEDGVLYIYAL